MEWKAIALVYFIELAIDSDQLKSRYDNFEKELLGKGISPEFSSIIFVHENDISTFLKNDRRPKLDFLPKVLEEICNELETYLLKGK